MSTEALQPVKEQALQVAEPSLMQMIDYAVRNGTAIEVLKELRAMRDADRAYAAKRAYDAAMEAAQNEISTVVPDADNEQTKRKYASFKALNAAIRPVYLKHGFSLSFNAAPSPNPNEIYILCDVTHDGGHTEHKMTPMSTDPSGPKGGGVMNKMQAYTAAQSYGRSGLLKLIFNIAIAEPEAQEGKRLDDLNERLMNMKDGDRKSLPKVYADNWAAAVAINDLQSLYMFIKARLALCETRQELDVEAKFAFEGVQAFKDPGLTKAVTGCINARKGELLK